MRNRWISWLLVAAMVAFSAAVFNQLPERMPMRWSLSGEVMSEQPRMIGSFALPAFAVLVILLRRGLRRVDPRRDNYERFDATYERYLRLTVLAIGVFHGLLLGSALAWRLPMVQILTLIGGVVLLFVANEARRVQPNWFLGIRTPWTLSDPDVWRATHAVAGRLLFGAALAIVVLGLAVPGAASIGVSIGLLAVVTGYLVYYSYHAYQQRHPPA